MYDTINFYHHDKALDLSSLNQHLEKVKRITDEELTFKQSLVDLYKNETKPINTYWAQMIPYENWVKATDYVAGK